MRRKSILSAALFAFAASLMLLGCDNSKKVEEEKRDKPIPPPIEMKTKDDRKSKLVKEDASDLPAPVRQK
jgi:hypothetical protein